METSSATNRSDGILKDVIAGLSKATTSTVQRSLAVVGCEGSMPAAPDHCLRSCLHGNATSASEDGCAWLKCAVAGNLDTSLNDHGICDKGFRIAAHSVRVGEVEGVVLSIEGAAESSQPPLRGFERLESVSRVLEHVGGLLQENEGLAEEVLRSYEQLNLIFEFTRRIADLTGTTEIEHVLLCTLGELLSAQAIAVVSEDGVWRYHAFGEQPPQSVFTQDGDPSGYAAKVQAVRTSRSVSAFTHNSLYVLAGPLSVLKSTEVVLIVRSHRSKMFDSGDMLLLESVLSFGGQIISNSALHTKLRRMSMETTRALVSAIDKKDHYTSGHSERVGWLAVLVGRELRLPEAQLEVLEWAGLLHDVGKIGVPEDILNKPGRLTDEEFDIIKKHPKMGYEILKPIASFEEVLDSVLHHHENPDGTGYPHGLVRDQIPQFARILHVVDVFDALSSTRSYRKSFEIEDALDIIRKEAGTKLDAVTADAFLAAIDRFRRQHPEEFAGMFCQSQEDEHAGI